jgi:hypothetical protein
LPAPFENTYFRERAIKAANRQKQGHILVSGAKPDNGQGKRLLVEGPLVNEAISFSQVSYRFGVTRRRNNPNYRYISQSTLRF